MYLQTEQGVAIKGTTEVFPIVPGDFEGFDRAMDRAKTLADKHATEKRSYVFDVMKVEIVDGGTFNFESEDNPTFKILTKGDEGLMVTEAMSETEMNGDYQSFAHGLFGKFQPGIYVAGDSYYIETASHEKGFETHQPIRTGTFTSQG